MTSVYEYDLFLSFSSADANRVRPVWQRLASSGLRVFWSDDTLRSRAGQSFVSVVQSALVNSRDFLLFWTANARTSSWVEEEYQTFYSQCYMRDKKGRRLIILRTEEPLDTLPPLLRHIQAVSTVDDLVTVVGGVNIEALVKRNAELEQLVAGLRQDLENALYNPQVEQALAQPEGASSTKSPASRAKKFVFEIVDRRGATHLFQNLRVHYPSRYGGLSREDGQVKIVRGTLEATANWKDLSEVHFIVKEAVGDDGGVEYAYDLDVTFKDGRKYVVALVPDFNMRSGGPGLLYGRSELGEAKIHFNEISTIRRVELLPKTA